MHKKIDEDGCTCGVGNSIDDALHDARTWLGEKVDAAKSWVKEAYEHK